MDAIPEVYDMLLSLRVVAAAMRRDISGHVANVRGSMLRLPDAQGTTLQGIVRYGLANHDRNELAKDPSSIVGGVLWLKCVYRRSNSDPLRLDTSPAKLGPVCDPSFEQWETFQFTLNSRSKVAMVGAVAAAAAGLPHSSSSPPTTANARPLTVTVATPPPTASPARARTRLALAGSRRAEARSCATLFHVALRALCMPRTVLRPSSALVQLTHHSSTVPRSGVFA